ncbi:MAG: serine/threonine protein kinase [Verrucomicrobia bacterium]|nr:serine/threonine protein kinase [Verrucomicrobiota bacterium]MCH8512432.1 serine/threonine protein kinase [Kiritimatiellia bacterium]
MSENAASLPGMTLGGYRICGRLGRGAMADVYDAEDSTGHKVALKVFRAGAGMSFTMIERFRREAEATKKLRRHPYILTVYATGHEGEFHYIAMERVEDSRSLESLTRKGASVEAFLKIGIKIAGALQYAHEHQIIHRDVKPSNILLDDFQEPMLADFGVAELMDWPSLTLSGTLTGTPMYMSPEQARGEEVTPASDVYSLAVVLYEALTGRMPYDLTGTPTTPQILDAVKNQTPYPARKADKRINRDLNFVLMRALRKIPGERYATAREFAHDLECVIEKKPVAGRWVSPWTATGYWVSRNRMKLSGALALALFAAAVTGAVREQLRESAYRELIQVSLRTSEQMKRAMESTSHRTEPEMRSAQRAMRAGRWLEARDLLQTAARVNQELVNQNRGSYSALFDAQIELARTETMLHNSLRARELYQAVWSREEAGPALRQIAAFEGILLLLLEDRLDDARRVKTEVSTLPSGPYLALMDMALGNLSAREGEAARQGLQPRLRAHAEIADIIRLRNREDKAVLHRRLDELARHADPPNSWPIPFATYLKGRL